MNILAAITIVLLLQQTMAMPGVENSVGSHASGTSVEPRTASESSAMIHSTLGNWAVMFHANAFLTSVQQTGPRGRDKLFSANWIMPALHRQIGRHGVTLRTMLSLEPATITKRQYPLLFQTGETAFDLAIIDGQHPHDLIMELAGKYNFALGEQSQVFVYGGPIGEAALGPTAFPHRSSASENPLAVLGHHQQDSTHIANNVITLGLAAGPIQLEASGFSGREPNENRWNFDSGKPDSFASRVTIAPHKSLSAQLSTGRLNTPEAGDPLLDIVRTTASVHHNVSFPAGHLSSSLIWGRNKDIKNGARRIFNAYNFESTAKFRGKNWFWTRLENVDRDRTLLPVQTAAPAPCRLCGVLGLGIKESPVEFSHLVPGPDGVPVNVEDEPIGRVQAYTFGYERELPVGPSWLSVGLGAQWTTYNAPPQLKSLYGDRPSTIAFFLRLRPAGNMAEHMRLMHRQ